MQSSARWRGVLVVPRNRTRLRSIATIVSIAALLEPACTKLESPNDSFGVRKTMPGTTPVGAGGTPSLNSTVSGGRVEDPWAGIAGVSTEYTTGGGGIAGIGGLAQTHVASQGGALPANGSAAGSTAIDGTAGSSCWDSSGLNGLGCNQCTPKTISEFESACTSAACTPFDNRKRLTRLAANGALPPLPRPATSDGSGGSAAIPATGGMVATAGRAGAASLGATTVAGGSTAFTCDQLGTSGKLVYVTGSSAAKPFLQQIAQQLASQSVYLVYTSTGSCIGVEVALNRTLIRTGPAPLPATSSMYWDSPTSSGKVCQLPSTGVVTDIGISDVFAQTCPGFELSSLEAKQVKDAHGPIQTMAFVVPSTSRALEISAQAAYFVFGFGAEGGVLDTSATYPIWSDESHILTRSSSSGTQAMLAAAIGVPSTHWRGKSHSSSDDVSNALQAALANSETADKAIGILAVDYIDSKNLRPQIRVLAFQDSNQPCAFYPDSSATARDKRNVRDGHYPIWSPLHLLYRVDANGHPENASSRQEVSDILGYLSGSKPLPNGVRLMDVFASSGLIPECAMRVARTNDGGNLIPFASGTPCACAFEQAATGGTTCKRCSVQGDCRDNETCSMGFCEA